jgi:hypothetical protein
MTLLVFEVKMFVLTCLLAAAIGFFTNGNAAAVFASVVAAAFLFKSEARKALPKVIQLRP